MKFHIYFRSDFRDIAHVKSNHQMVHQSRIWPQQSP